MEKIQIFLNSKSANAYTNGNTADCTFHLPVIHVPRHRKVYVSVQTAQIPYSFYNINSINNTLKYTDNSGSVQTLTIPIGNYNVSTMIAAIIAEEPDFSITYDIKTNKLTFTHSTYDFTLESDSTCFEVIGFNDNATYTSSSQSLTSTLSLNLFTIRNIYIVMNY